MDKGDKIEGVDEIKREFLPRIATNECQVVNAESRLSQLLQICIRPKSYDQVLLTEPANETSTCHRVVMIIVEKVAICISKPKI